MVNQPACKRCHVTDGVTLMMEHEKKLEKRCREYEP